MYHKVPALQTATLKGFEHDTISIDHGVELGDRTPSGEDAGGSAVGTIQ